MYVTLSGITISVKKIQPEKAIGPISLTLLGSSIFFKPEPKKADAPIVLIVSGSVIFLTLYEQRKLRCQ